MTTEDCIKNLCRAVAESYMTSLLLKPMSCYKDTCRWDKRCLKRRTTEPCNEQKFLKLKEMFSEHIETPQFWFKGAELDLAFSRVEKIYRECSCLEDVRKKLKIKVNKETIENKNDTHLQYIYKVYDKKDNKFIYEDVSLKNIAERLNSSLGVVRATLVGKNTYLKDNYIIKRVVK